MALFEVVKFNGGADVFAWKYPNEELGTWTQLIVNESQEAVLYKGGMALDLFTSGRHTLDTANIPILNNIVNLPFGGRSPFTAEVWFVNKLQALDIKWGTSSPIQIQDPKYGLFVPVRAYGQFGIRIIDSQEFLSNLVGTMPVFDRATMTSYFKGIYMTKVKDAISSYLIHKKISILEINAYLEEISDFIYDKVSPIMAEYGLQMGSFSVNDISVPENDPAVVKLKNALAKRAEMNIIGYNYQQERSFDTMEGAATNPGSSSNIMGAGMGLSMGVNLGNMMGAQMSDNMNAGAGTPCPKCNHPISGGKRFCANCGYDTTSQPEPTQKSQPNICSGCNNPLLEGAKFCPHCGKKCNPCPKCHKDMKLETSTCPSCGYEAPLPCPECGTLIDKNLKFCPECGISLIKSCAKCNTIIEGEPKFCPHCGDKL